MVKYLCKYRIKYSFHAWFILLTLNFLLFFIPDASAATQASFAWMPNSEPDLAGYRIFCREQSQPYDYANPFWEGTNTTSTIYDLDESKSYCFVVRAFDTEGYESENSTEACLGPSGISSQLPVADAGPDQIVNEGQTVALNGSNSTDPNGGIASYHWVQLDGPGVNLSDPDVTQLTFTAPNVGPEGAALSFELTVTDHDGNQGKDTCVVNVTWQNEPPRAIAGADQTVDEGAMVTLDGSLSLDIDDGISSYLWTQVGVPTVALSNPASSMPTFIAPDVGPDGLSLTFSLTVTDAGNLQNTDSCIVNISWQNEPPIALVTPNYLETTEKTFVTLDGSTSTDSDDGIASYLWTQTEGDPVSLSNPASAVTSFTAPKTDALDKNIELRLTVTDHGGLKGTTDSTIYVMQNDPITLNSVVITGPSQVNEGFGAQYILVANYSDGTSIDVTSLASWNDNSSYASIDSDGYLTSGAVVSDQSCVLTANYWDQSGTYHVMIKDLSSTKAPAVDFSYATKKKKIMFTDRSTDSDGTIVSWRWDFGNGQYSTEQHPDHRYTQFGEYLVTLTVTDSEGASNSISKPVSIIK
jgi:chitodextrinase